MLTPFGSMIVGFLAGTISVLGFKYLSVRANCHCLYGVVYGNHNKCIWMVPTNTLTYLTLGGVCTRSEACLRGYTQTRTDTPQKQCCQCLQRCVHPLAIPLPFSPSWSRSWRFRTLVASTTCMGCLVSWGPSLEPSLPLSPPRTSTETGEWFLLMEETTLMWLNRST